MSVVGTLWSAVATVRSGRRTVRPARRSPSKAWGDVTSWIRCRSMKSRSGSPSARVDDVARPRSSRSGCVAAISARPRRSAPGACRPAPRTRRCRRRRVPTSTWPSGDSGEITGRSPCRSSMEPTKNSLGVVLVVAVVAQRRRCCPWRRTVPELGVVDDLDVLEHGLELADARLPSFPGRPWRRGSRRSRDRSPSARAASMWLGDLHPAAGGQVLELGHAGGRRSPGSTWSFRSGLVEALRHVVVLRRGGPAAVRRHCAGCRKADRPRHGPAVAGDAGSHPC